MCDLFTHFHRSSSDVSSVRRGISVCSQKKLPDSLRSQLRDKEQKQTYVRSNDGCSPFLRVVESQIGTYQNREGVERRRLREQKEGSGGAFGRSGGRRWPAAGGVVQGGGYLRAAASSSTSLLREDHGE